MTIRMTKDRQNILVLDSQGDLRKRWGKGNPPWRAHYSAPNSLPLPSGTIPDGMEKIAVLIATPAEYSAWLAASARRTDWTPAVILLTEDAELAGHWNRLGFQSGVTFLCRDAPPDRLWRAVDEALSAHPDFPGPVVFRNRRAGNTPKGSSPSAGKSKKFPAGKGFSSAIQFKEDWVKVVAHDIRSPLSIINGYATLLQEDRHQMSEQGKMILERIQDTGGWMIDLIDNILDLSMIEEGRLTLKCAPVQLDVIMNTIVDRLKMLAESKSICLGFEPSGDSSHYFLDHHKIEQVLQNLVTNGIKFSSAGGRIGISCQAEQDLVTFSVEDTGQGLTREQAKRIFDKYFRQAPCSHLGSGLGLAIAKSLVESHGGEIWVESTPGKGSKFSFTVVPQSA